MAKCLPLWQSLPVPVWRTLIDHVLCESVDMHEDSHVLLHRIRVTEKDNWHACKRRAFYHFPQGLEKKIEYC